MSQMKANDLKEVKAIPGNDKCCDCGMKHPQWASVSFGNVFCLECSGVHRSLGVHISFVRSIAMDSWTPQQLVLMKKGGNDTCNNFLYSRGVPKTASIKQKYDSDAAALYKEVLKARAEGRPEPTEISKKKAVKKAYTPSTTGMGGNGGGGGGSQDSNGMERLAGETDQQYIARQTRLREEARVRMAAKFGNGNGSKRTMGGIGSSPHPSSSSSGVDAFNMDAITGTLSSGIGSAATGLSSAFSFASGAVNSSSARNVAKDVSSMGMGLWSTLSSSAKEVANNMNMEGMNMNVGMDGFGAANQEDGLASLRQQVERERSARGSSGTAYAGFGSESVLANNGTGSSRGTGGMKQNTASVGSVGSNSSGSNSNNNISNNNNNYNNAIMTGSHHDLSSAAPLPGESDQTFMQRQLKIREEAKAKAAAAKASASATSGAPMGGGAVAKLKVDKDDDFFASFGA